MTDTITAPREDRITSTNLVSTLPGETLNWFFYKNPVVEGRANIDADLIQRYLGDMTTRDLVTPVDEFLRLVSQELSTRQPMSTWSLMGTASVNLPIGGTATSLQWRETPKFSENVYEAIEQLIKVVQNSQTSAWLAPATEIPFEVEISIHRGTTIPQSLLRKQKHAIRKAKVYRKDQGDPVDDLVEVLSQVVTDEETWREILDEPYG